MEAGIITVTLTDRELESFYKGNYIIKDIKTNQYVFIKDSNETLVDKQKWDGEKFTPLRVKEINSRRIGKVRPLNDEQFALFDLLQNQKITIKEITGIAGSGKNYCTMSYALNEIDKESSIYKKIVLVRNNIEVKDSMTLGALPAGINDKLMPYAMPAVDIIGDAREFQALLSCQKVELLHLGFCRGRNFDNSIVIVDECENLTTEHVALLVSRVGKDSTIIFLGDTAQVDKPVFEKNPGLDRLNACLLGHELYGCVHLVKSERSPTAALAALIK